VNLKSCGGRVPVFVGGETPYIFVDFPSRDSFDDWNRRCSQDNRDKYWSMLVDRAKGASLIECAKPYGLSRERARQIEARFLRQVKTSLKSDSHETNRP
jgi:hypothetical protein